MKRAIVAALPALAVALTGIAWRQYEVHRFLNCDEGVFSAIADKILAGGIPYRDGWEIKGPLLYYWYAGAYKLFGHDLIALRLGAAVWVLLTQLALYGTVARLYDWRAGCWAGVSYAALTALGEGQSANAELLMVLPIAASMYCGVRAAQEDRLSWWALAGVLAGLGALVKQVAVLDAAGLAAFILVIYLWTERPRRWARAARALALLSLGIAAPLLLTCTFFWARGAWTDFLNAFLLFNFRYVGSVPMARFASDGVWRLARGTVIELGGIPLLALAGAAGVMGWAREARLSEGDRRDPRAVLRLLLVFWALSSVAGVSLGRRFLAHYFVELMPPTAALAGPMIAQLMARWRVSGWRDERNLFSLACALLPLTLMACKLQVTVASLGEATRSPRYRTESRSLGEHLRDVTGPDDSLWVWGFDAEVYYWAQRRCASRHVMSAALVGLTPGSDDNMPSRSLGRAVPGSWEALERDLARDPPAYIVDAQEGGSPRLFTAYPPESFPRLMAILTKQYEPPTRYGVYRLYRRRANQR